MCDQREQFADLVTPCPVGFTDLPKAALATQSVKEFIKADCSMTTGWDIKADDENLSRVVRRLMRQCRHTYVGGNNVAIVSATVRLRGAMAIVLSDNNLEPRVQRGFANTLAKESMSPKGDGALAKTV